MAGVMELPLSGGKVALINADDFERKLFCEFRGGHLCELSIADRKWKVFPKYHTSYATCTTQSNGCIRELRLHRLVLCARAGDIVDHIDGNGLNCVRTNLRFTSAAGNSHNSLSRRGASSRFKGVALHRQTGKWEASIRHMGRKRHLGLHFTEALAAIAYDNAARDLFGETALLNF